MNLRKRTEAGNTYVAQKQFIPKNVHRAHSEYLEDHADLLTIISQRHSFAECCWPLTGCLSYHCHCSLVLKKFGQIFNIRLIKTILCQFLPQRINPARHIELRGIHNSIAIICSFRLTSDKIFHISALERVAVRSSKTSRFFNTSKFLDLV